MKRVIDSSRRTPMSLAILMILALALLTGMFTNGNYSSSAYDYRTRDTEGWSEDVRITVRPEGPDSQPVIATSGNKVHLVWTRAVSRVMYTRSSDSGETWSEFQQLSFDGMHSNRASIAVAGDTIHVVWDDTGGIAASEVRYTRSTDGGITWSEPMFISSDDGHPSESPKIAVSEDGMDVHVVWVDWRHSSDSFPPNYEIYYNRSHDGGMTWEGEVRFTDAWYRTGGPNIAVYGSSVHVVWMDERAGKWDIYYRQSPDSGATWDDEIIISNSPNHEGPADVAVSGDTIHVVWDRTVSGEDLILHRFSTDNGLTWGVPQVLTTSPVRSVRPRIALNGDVVHLVWFDGRDGGDEIYYKNYISEVWGPDTRLTYTDNSDSLTPNIAVYDDYIHVTWYDDRDGVWEVYYKRNPDFISIPEFGNVTVPVVATIVIYVGLVYLKKKEV